MGEKFLLQLIDLFNIQQVVAVGNKAEQTLYRVNIPCRKVRHPAQGGKRAFVEGIKDLKESMLDKGMVI